MAELVPPGLIAPGVDDARSRAFAGALAALLETIEVTALLVQDARTVPAALLPAMLVEAGLTDFVSPGMREPHVRALIAAAPAIHAMSGTIAGVRRALAAVGMEVDWTQWWQKTPPGPHDTHTAFLTADDSLIEGQHMLSAANQAAARRLIDATKRWSQDVAIQYGVRASGTGYVAAFARTHVVATAQPLALDPPVLGSAIYTAAVAATRLSVTAQRKAA